MDDLNIWDVLGWVIKWAICIGVALLAISFLIWLAGPVIDQVSGVFGSLGGSYGGNDIYGLAVLCIVLIGIVGAIKAFRK